MGYSARRDRWKEEPSRLGNRSALGMLYRKFNSCNAEWEEWGYMIVTPFHTKSL